MSIKVIDYITVRQSAEMWKKKKKMEKVHRPIVPHQGSLHQRPFQGRNEQLCQVQHKVKKDLIFQRALLTSESLSQWMWMETRLSED